MELFVVVASLALLLFLGVSEKKRNEANLAKIPLRINVNGVRGKSTITRLITSVLAEAGYESIGKTTGTAPRMIFNQEKEEHEIKRYPKGVTISEQLDVIDYAAGKEVDALVCECMAVDPEYQRIYQEEMIQANIGVIVNVLEDHMDVMGPTLDEVALAFTSSIPYNGTLVIQDNEYREYFTDIAKKRNTKVFVADESLIPDDYLDSFDFKVFPNNVAISLAVAEALDIDREIALKGMLKANPDPGALRAIKVIQGSRSFTFVNGFAVNDPDSAFEVMEEIFQDYGEDCLILFNGRSDRIDRSQQFARDFFPKLDRSYDLLVIGEDLDSFELEKDTFKAMQRFTNMENQSGGDVFKHLLHNYDGKVIIALGNIHGHGYELLDYVERFEEASHHD